MSEVLKKKNKITNDFILYNDNKNKPAASNHYILVHVRQVRYGSRSTRLITVHIEHATVTERSVQTTADRQKGKLCTAAAPLQRPCRCTPICITMSYSFLYTNVMCCYVIVTVECNIDSRIVEIRT